MGNEINVVIDNLCNKLGTTVENLIPELARYHITMQIMGIVLCVVVIFVGVGLYHKGIKTDDFYADDWLIAIGIFLAVVATFVAIILVVQLTGWIASPTAAGISKLIHLLGR